MHHSGHCPCLVSHDRNHANAQTQYLAFDDLRDVNLLLMLPANFDIFRSAGQRIGVQILAASAEI